VRFIVDSFGRWIAKANFDGGTLQRRTGLD